MTQKEVKSLFRTAKKEVKNINSEWLKEGYQNGFYLWFTKKGEIQKIGFGATNWLCIQLAHPKYGIGAYTKKMILDKLKEEEEFWSENPEKIDFK